MNILIVEDEEFSREMLQGFLVQLGYEVTATSNGTEAWSLIERGEFKCVITDWLMPGMDGLDLIRLIRSRNDGAYIYTILLTAKDQSQDVVQGIMDGADDYLTKPYNCDELEARIRSGIRVIELEERLKARNFELNSAKSKLEETNNKLSLAHDRMKNDLEAAARIQRSLLPDSAPNNAALDCAWVFRPCDELAGDIFDIFLLDEQHIGFYLLDVAGHGVPAALLSVTLSRILSPSVGQGSVLFSQNPYGSHPRTPSEILLELNQRFQVREDYEKFFTILFGLLNLDSRELRYVSAGNPRPILATNHESPKFLTVGGLPVGVMEEPGYVDEVMYMEPGDCLYLYSDGVLDARNCHGDVFGCDELIKCVYGSGDSLASTVTAIEDKALGWCNGKPQDDISVLAIKIQTTGS